MKRGEITHCSPNCSSCEAVKACDVKGSVLDAAQETSNKTDDQVLVGPQRTPIVWEFRLHAMAWHHLVPTTAPKCSECFITLNARKEMKAG